MAYPGYQHRGGDYVNQQKVKFEHGPSSASGSRENQTKNHDTIPANVGVEQRDHGTMYSKTEDLHRSADGASAKNTTSAKASGSRENQTKYHDTIPANVGVEQRDHGTMYSKPEDLHRSADGASAKNTTSAKETKSIFIRELFEGEEYHKMRYVFDAKPKKEDLKSILSKQRYVYKKIGDQLGLIVPSSVKTEDVEDHLLPLIRELSVFKLNCNGDTYSSMKSCFDICAKLQAFRDEIVMLFQDQENDKSILIVGPREECKKAKAYIEKELMEKEKANKEVHSTSQVVIPVLLDSLDMLILEHTLALDVVTAKSSGVTLNFDKAKTCIYVTGPHHLTTEAYGSIRAQLKQYRDSHVVWEDPAIYIKLLQKADVQRYLNEQLKMKDTACHWFPYDNEVHVFSASKESSEQCLAIMKDYMKTNLIPLDSNIESILDTECSEFENKMVWEKGRDKEGSTVIIVATTNDVFKQLEKYLKNKYTESKMEEIEICADNLDWEFCKESFREELDHQRQKVKIEHKGDRLLVSGVKSNVLEADRKIRELLMNTHKREMVLYGEKEISRLQKHHKAGSKTVLHTDESEVLLTISDQKTVMDPLKDVEYGNGKQWIFADGRPVILQLAKWQDCDADTIILCQQETKEDSGKSVFNFEEGKNEGRKVFSIYLPPYGEGRNKEAEKLEETMNIISQEMKDRTLGVPLDQIHFVRWKGMLLMKRILRCFVKEKDFLKVSKLFFTHQSEMDLHRYRDVITGALIDCTYQTDFYSDRNFELEVREASLVDTLKVDVLVNTTDKQMNLEQGVVSKLILNKCGDELKEECARHHSKPLVYGEVVVTGTGKGREYGWKKILHGALPPWTGSENISILVHFVAECLRHASDLGLQSIAFPAIGTGKLGYLKNVAAKAIMTGILDYRKAYPQKSPRQILLTLFDKKDVQIFKGELSTQLKRRKIKDVGGCISFSIRPSLQLILTQTDIRVHAVDCLLVFWCQDEIYKANRPEGVLNKEYLKETGKILSENFLSKRACLQSMGCITTDECLPYGRIVHQAIDKSDLTGSVAKGLTEAGKYRSRRVGIVISMKDQTSSQLENWSCAIHAGANRLAKQQNGVTVREIIVSCEDILFSKSVYHILQRHSKENQTVPTSKHTPELCCEIRILGTSEDAVKEKEKQIRAMINPTGTEGASSSKEANVTTVTDESSNENTGKAPSTSNDGNKTPRRRKELTLTDKEKCCLLVHCKMDESSRHTMQKNQLEEQLTKTHKTEFSRFVYPFLDAGQGLLKFHTSVDAKKFLTESSKEDMFLVEAFPPQAVNNIEAKLSADVQKVLVNFGITRDSIEENTGAVLHMNVDTWTLTGNLLEIKVAEKYIKEQIHNHSRTKSKENMDFNANQSTRTPSPPCVSRRNTSASATLSEDTSPRIASSSSSKLSDPLTQQSTYEKLDREKDFVSKETYNILKYMNKELPWEDIKFWEKEQGIQLFIPHLWMESFQSAKRAVEALYTEHISLQDQDNSIALATCISKLETETSKIYIKKEPYKITIKGGDKKLVEQTKEKIERVIISYANHSTMSPSSPGGARIKTPAASAMSSEDKFLSSHSDHWPQQSNESKIKPEQEEKVSVSTETYNVLKYMNKELPWEYFKRSESEQRIQLSIPHSWMEPFQTAKRDAEALSTEEIILQEHESNMELVKCISELEAKNTGIYIKQESNKITIKGLGKVIVRQAREKIQAVINKAGGWEKQGKGKGRMTAGSNIGKSQKKKGQSEKVKPPNGAKMLTDKGFSVYVYRGDICNLKVDGIVNPTNESLDLEHGVSGCIILEAGDEVTQVLKQTFGESSGIEIGKVFCTHAGSLDYEQIFHAVCPKWISYFKSDDKIRQCEGDLHKILLEILKSAERDCTSIGIPAIGAGKICGIPKVLCANSYAKCIKEFCQTKRSKGLDEAHFVDTTEDMVNMIRVAFKFGPIPWIFQRHNGGGLITLCSSLKVSIYKGYFVAVNAQAVAVAEGEDFSGKRWAVSQLLRNGGETYKEGHKRLKKSLLPHNAYSVHQCTGDYKFSFRTVLHVILPQQNQYDRFIAAYKKGIKEMLSAVKNHHVRSLAMPFLGGGSDDPRYQTGCAAVLAEELMQFSQDNNSYLTDIHIVNGDSPKGSINELLIGAFQEKIKAKYPKNNNLLKYLTVKEPVQGGQATGHVTTPTGTIV